MTYKKISFFLAYWIFFGVSTNVLAEDGDDMPPPSSHISFQNNSEEVHFNDINFSELARSSLSQDLDGLISSEISIERVASRESPEN